MAKTKTYATVSELVRGSSDNPDFADAFEKRLASRKIAKDLIVLRAKHGMSQKDIAAKLGCTQSRISKLESAHDHDLRLGDLASYADALGLCVRITLQPKESTAASRVKTLALQINNKMDRLTDLASNDQATAKSDLTGK